MPNPRRRKKARQAEAQERQTAEKRLAQVTKMNEILGSIFRDLDPQNAAKEGKPLSAVLGERLDQATAEIEGEATGDPLAVARMQMTLGDSQLGLGYPKKAIGLFEKARATFTAKLGPDHPDTLHEHEQPRPRLCRRRTVRPRARAPGGDAGIAKGEARPGPPRHAR